MIEVTGTVDVGHVGRLTAEKGDALRLAGGPDTGDELHPIVLRKVRGGQIVEEEERPCADREDVVDAVIDQVGPDRVVAAECTGNQQLRTDAVRAGDQHRLAVADRHTEEAGEWANAAEHLGAHRGGGNPCKPPDRAVSCRDIHPGVNVTERGLRSLAH